MDEETKAALVAKKERQLLQAALWVLRDIDDLNAPSPRMPLFEARAASLEKARHG